MIWTCKSNCGSCCGIVPIPLRTFLTNGDKHQRLVKGTIEWSDGKDVVPETEDGLCVFLTKMKTCAIYDERPSICRMYGVDIRLPCPYIKPNGNARGPAKVRRMQRKIEHNVDYQLRVLHKRCNRKI